MYEEFRVIVQLHAILNKLLFHVKSNTSVDLFVIVILLKKILNVIDATE